MTPLVVSSADPGHTRNDQRGSTTIGIRIISLVAGIAASLAAAAVSGVRIGGEAFGTTVAVAHSGDNRVLIWELAS